MTIQSAITPKSVSVERTEYALPICELDTNHRYFKRNIIQIDRDIQVVQPDGGSLTAVRLWLEGEPFDHPENVTVSVKPGHTFRVTVWTSRYCYELVSQNAFVMVEKWNPPEVIGISSLEDGTMWWWF